MFQINTQLLVKSFSVGIEKQKVLIIDNFMQQPEHMVDYASARENFEHYTGHCNFYPGIKLPAPKEYSDSLMAVIKPILAQGYEGISLAWDMNKADCSLSLITIKPESLRKVQLMPHFDSTNPYQFALLLFLCNETHGGTAFYRHNTTGYETITQEKRKSFEDIYFREIEEKPLKKEYFTDSDERFTKLGVADAKFNRMIIYRSCLLHSPYIDSTYSVDDNPKTGRLTANSFVAF
ncbi:DUF6445 family protein [Cellvibrio sp. PSBB006]|uniref:DUF6445 family protein n=1 Tax=Cellvibrio sp. PSBB006 TaxID=1987723 RepID=UPI0012F799FA|nr:DUF6445 family protein [Cellvibrio sp. PSBB006]